MSHSIYNQQFYEHKKRNIALDVKYKGHTLDVGQTTGSKRKYFFYEKIQVPSPHKTKDLPN